MDNGYSGRSSEEIRKEIEELERQKQQAIEESNRQTMQSQIEQQNNDLIQQTIDQMTNTNMMDF